MPIDADDNYDLVRPDILDNLGNADWFTACLDQFYQEVAALWGCEVKLSAARLLSAHDFYLEDIARTRNFGMDPEEEAKDDEESELILDQFKHAAFMAYWLKRSVPINTLNPVGPDGAAVVSPEFEPSHDQRFFIRYANEYCALLAGFKIVLNYQLQARYAAHPGDAAAKDEELGRILDAVQMPDRFVREFPRLLKHESVSPYAIYMILCALFDQVDVDLEGR